MGDKNFTFNFNAPVGQNIANVEHMDVHLDKDGQIRVMNAEQVNVQNEQEADKKPDDKVAAAIKAVHEENICKQADWAVIVRILEEKKKIKKSTFLADARYINEVCGAAVTNADSLARASIFTKVIGTFPYWRITDGEETRETDGLLRKYKTIGEIFVKALEE